MKKDYDDKPKILKKKHRPNLNNKDRTTPNKRSAEHEALKIASNYYERYEDDQQA